MKSKNQDRSCYMCGGKATSREHVPPLCLFPEEKDINTFSFRHNLITVPSCAEHNSKKSKDDEFLMACLASIVGNNVIGFIHTQTKVRRALERKDDNFIHSIIRDPKHLNLKSDNGTVFPVSIGRPDVKRLTNCFLHIASGLYHYKFNKRFDGKCHILIDFIVYEEEETEKYKLLCRKRFEAEPNMPHSEGSNPKIFSYTFFEPDELGQIAMRMIFYEGATVFAVFQPSSVVQPFHLINALIDTGIQVNIFFNDGAKFQFNKKKEKEK